MLTVSSVVFQCRPSKGRKRGYCWCVDKYGQPLPGYDGKGKGDVHCYNLESKWGLGASSSGICAWPLDLAKTSEGLGKHCGLRCESRALPPAVDGEAQPLWTLLHPTTNTHWASYRMCRELWIPMKTCTIDTQRERKKPQKALQNGFRESPLTF